MRTTTCAILALVTLSGIASAQQLVGQEESVFNISERLVSGGAVRIFSRAGDITISEGSGSTVELRGEKDVRRGKVEDIGFRVLRDSAGVTICAVFSGDVSVSALLWVDGHSEADVGGADIAPGDTRATGVHGRGR